MLRYVFGLIVLLSSGMAFAGTCSVIVEGTYTPNQAADDACHSQYGNYCGYSPPGVYYPQAVYGWAEIVRDTDAVHFDSNTVRADCSTTSTNGYSTTFHNFLAYPSCPSGTSSYPTPSGDQCLCDNGGAFDPVTQLCGDPPPTPDDDPTPPDTDDSPNTGDGGGDGNDFGGDPNVTGDGSECNFTPEGCIPGDTPSPPDLTNLDPPDAETTPPPEAVTGKQSTANNPDGSVTDTKKQSWEESDGCKVSQDTTVITQPDGSAEKTTTTTRRCPDGTVSSTTGTWTIDSGGTSTLTGSSSDKSIEGGDDDSRSASGGSDCTAPPRCTGDAIDCAQLQQQWLTRCDKNSDFTDSDCSAQPSCDGDVLLCAGLIYKWQDRCMVKKAAYDADQWFKQQGFQTAEEVSAAGGAVPKSEVDLSSTADEVFSARSSVSGSCPAPIAVDLGPFGAHSISLDAFCDLADNIYWLVLLSAYMTAAFIIFRAATASD